jgi:hypothetical protein
MSGQDTNAITSIINLYGFAVDTQCWDLFDRIFTEDVDVDFSTSARWQDRASFKHDFAVFHDPFDSTQHAMLNHLVHVEGEKAFAFTYGNWRLIRKAVDGDPRWDGTGWYDDALVRTSDGWRIVKRVCRIMGWSGNPFVNETIPGVKFELNTTVLRKDGAAGRVGFLNAITGKEP